MKQQYEPTDFDKEDGFFEIPNKKYVAIVDKELTVVGKELTQSQAHGFTIENDIKEKVFGITEQNVNNTNIHDIECEQNKFNKNENISIKTSCSACVECGDIIRIFKYDFTRQNTIILVLLAQSSPTEKTIKEVIEINYTEKLHNLLFGSITLEELEEYVNLVKSIPSGKNTDKTYLKNKKELQQKHQMNLSINPKVDSKSQRRVQCKIPLKLFEQYPEYILYRNTEAIVREVEITKTIQSSPRKRSKKEI